MWTSFCLFIKLHDSMYNRYSMHSLVPKIFLTRYLPCYASYKWISNNIFHAQKWTEKEKQSVRKKNKFKFSLRKSFEKNFIQFIFENLIFPKLLFSFFLAKKCGRRKIESMNRTAAMRWMKNVYKHCQKCSTAIFHNF